MLFLQPKNEETVTHIVYILSCRGTRYHGKRGNISSLLMFRQDNGDTVAYSTERRQFRHHQRMHEGNKRTAIAYDANAANRFRLSCLAAFDGDYS